MIGKRLLFLVCIPFLVVLYPFVMVTTPLGWVVTGSACDQVDMYDDMIANFYQWSIKGPEKPKEISPWEREEAIRELEEALGMRPKRDYSALYKMGGF